MSRAPTPPPTAPPTMAPVFRFFGFSEVLGATDSVASGGFVGDDVDELAMEDEG